MVDGCCSCSCSCSRPRILLLLCCQRWCCGNVLLGVAEFNRFVFNLVCKTAFRTTNCSWPSSVCVPSKRTLLEEENFTLTPLECFPSEILSNEEVNLIVNRWNIKLAHSGGNKFNSSLFMNLNHSCSTMFSLFYVPFRLLCWLKLTVTMYHLLQ